MSCLFTCLEYVTACWQLWIKEWQRQQIMRCLPKQKNLPSERVALSLSGANLGVSRRGEGREWAESGLGCRLERFNTLRSHPCFLGTASGVCNRDSAGRSAPRSSEMVGSRASSSGLDLQLRDAHTVSLCPTPSRGRQATCSRPIKSFICEDASVTAKTSACLTPSEPQQWTTGAASRSTRRGSTFSPTFPVLAGFWHLKSGLLYFLCQEKSWGNPKCSIFHFFTKKPTAFSWISLNRLLGIPFMS